MDRINGADVFDIGGGRRGFRSQNAMAGINGTEVTDKFLNDVQEEIIAVLDEAEIVPSPDDQKQLYKAIAQNSQSGKWNYAVASGTPNALTATFTPQIFTYHTGITIHVRIGADNTDEASLAVDGLAALPILTMRGQPLVRGDLPAGGVCTFICTGDAWLFTGLVQSEVPIIGSPTLWVRTDGNDENDGLENTSDRALATITEALARLGRYTLVGDGAFIRLGIPGTYQAPGGIAGVNGLITIMGDAASPASYIASDISVPFGNALFTTSGRIKVLGMMLHSTRASVVPLGAYSGGNTAVEDVIIQTTVPTNTLVSSSYNSTVSLGDGCNLRGAAAVGIEARSGTVTISGAVSWSNGAAYSTCNIRCLAGGRVVTTGAGSASGSATGVRYAASQCSVITTNGGGVNFFPGSVAGSADATSSYS